LTIVKSPDRGVAQHDSPASAGTLARFGSTEEMEIMDTTAVIILACIAFVVPLVIIVADDGNWDRKK